MTLVKANLEDLRSAASTLGEVATCVEDRHDALRNKALPWFFHLRSRLKY